MPDEILDSLMTTGRDYIDKIGGLQARLDALPFRICHLVFYAYATSIKQANPRQTPCTDRFHTGKFPLSLQGRRP